VSSSIGAAAAILLVAGTSAGRGGSRMSVSIEDPQVAKALWRYEIVSRYLAIEPRCAQRRRLREELAAQTWLGPDGEPWRLAAATIRVWVARYRRDGLAGLMDRSSAKDKPSPSATEGAVAHRRGDSDPSRPAPAKEVAR